VPDLRSIASGLQAAIETRLNLTVIAASRWKPYRDAWDRPDLGNSMSPLAHRINSLHHGQVAQIALASKLIYFAIPKSANSYMRRWVNSVEAELAWSRSSAISEVLTYDPSSQYCYTLAQLPGGVRNELSSGTFACFTVVREPGIRALSCFLDKRRQGTTSAITRKLPKRAWRDFGSFVEALARGENRYLDGHWAPQTWILKPVWSDLDAILRVEDMPFTLDEFAQERHLPKVRVPGDQETHVTRAHHNWKRYVHAETHAMLSDIYAEDYLALHYARPTI